MIIFGCALSECESFLVLTFYLTLYGRYIHIYYTACEHDQQPPPARRYGHMLFYNVRVCVLHTYTYIAVHLREINYNLGLIM